MGCRAPVVVALACVTACSWTMKSSSPKRQTAAVESVCQRPWPLADTLAGATLVGMGVGTGLVGIDEGGWWAASAIGLTAAGIAFFVSAKHGYDEQAECYQEELIAARKDTTPLHIPVARAGRTCVQRRLDMYSQAVTGADPLQRAQLLAALPTCDESAEREHAWRLTKNAAIDAGNGKCDEIESIADQVYRLDVGLHDVVLLGDVQIKYCLQHREL